MKFVLVLFSALSVFLYVCQAQDAEVSNQEFPALSGPYLGQTPPGMEPELFAPGIIPVDGVQHCYPAFSPNGRAVYWMIADMSGERPRGEIWFSEEKDSIWTPPAVAPFSGEHNDAAPFFSHDGNCIYFASSRPGGIGPRKNIWYVERTETGWSEPIHLGAPPNSDIGVSQATFSRAGSVYFVGRFETGQWSIGIYFSQYLDGSYQQPEAMGPRFNTEQADAYPFIAGDESYLIFGSSRPGAKSTETDLYISFRDDKDQWGVPVRLGDAINNGKTVSFACVTHDGKYLFFNRFDEDGTDKFYWVDAKILDSYRP